ncbi:MAG: spheroidene monooxygenase [Burkholderiaceae bacterium]|jgi:spheroidene monooxygenase|nr:spheroidene monooxygenase [Burkholderiaceae bacterium]
MTGTGLRRTAVEAAFREPKVSPADSVVDPGASGGGPVAVLLLIELAPGALLWGWSRVALGALLLRHVPGLRFVKALGSGQRGGFGLRPSLRRQGLFALFDRERDADAFIAASPVMQAYRSHAGELCIAKLRATSSRGSWSGQGIAVTKAPASGGRVASLTRASIRPHKAWAFWRNSPPAEAALERSEGCLLAMGLGEAPLLRQATFSVWESQAAMDAYARSGAHLAAIRAAYGQNQFSESMFVRFELLQLSGTWKDRRYG